MNIHIAYALKTGLLLILLITATVGLAAGPSRADIYAWKDADGILHFSNHNPPAEARFHMIEYLPAQDPEPALEDQKTNGKTDDLRAQLDAANRKLDTALDQVDDLSKQVEATRREATAAAEAARRAAAEAAAADEARPEKTVVFGLPYRRPDHPPRPVPYYWKLDTTRYPYYQDPKTGPHHPGTRTPSNVSVNIRRSGGNLAAGTLSAR